MQCIGKKIDILLRCHFASYESKADKSWKRVNVMDRDLAPSAKRDACAEKISEDEKIVVSLRGKHSSQYSTEKLSAWIHIGKHDSLDTPPNLPYFAKNNSDPEASMPCLSPGKRIHRVRGPAIEVALSP